MPTPYPDPSANRAPAPTALIDEPAANPLEHLTAEEQMALFEAELKQNDWGHQPC